VATDGQRRLRMRQTCSTEPDDKRKIPLRVYVSEEEKALIDQAARDERVSSSTYGRVLILRGIKRRHVIAS